jgi:hypothetical protein
MKTQILTCLAAGILLGAVPSQGKDVRSPDGQFAVRAESAISLVNLSGALILTLVRDTSGDAKVEVAWSPDSRHVVVVENGERVGSGIVAAWKDEVWHKTIELESQVGGLIQAQQVKFHSRLVAEHRKLNGWVTPSQVLVEGDMTFANGAKYRYGYTLAFRPGGPVRLDRGGYEEGELIGKDFHGL